MNKLLLLILLSPFLALAKGKDSVLTFMVDSISQKKFSPGDTVALQFTVNIEKPWHLYANTIKDEYLIPSRLEIKGEGGKVIDIDYPKGIERTFMGISDFLYEGKITLPVKIRIVKAGLKKLEAIFHYQACNDRMCLPPASKSLILQLP